MSFRTAYMGLKSNRRASKPQGPLRDPTPEQWKKIMQDYYIQQNKNNKSNLVLYS